MKIYGIEYVQEEDCPQVAYKNINDAYLAIIDKIITDYIDVTIRDAQVVGCADWIANDIKDLINYNFIDEDVYIREIDLY